MTCSHVHTIKFMLEKGNELDLKCRIDKYQNLTIKYFRNNVVNLSGVSIHPNRKITICM